MTKIDLTPIEDTLRHLREELAKVSEANAQQSETIRRYQQDARTRIARSGE